MHLPTFISSLLLLDPSPGSAPSSSFSITHTPLTSLTFILYSITSSIYSQGIGGATALLFGKEGASVVVSDLDDGK